MARGKAERKECVCVCGRERGGGVKVSREKFAQKYEDTSGRREQINKGCFL